MWSEHRMNFYGFMILIPCLLLASCGSQGVYVYEGKGKPNALQYIDGSADNPSAPGEQRSNYVPPSSATTESYVPSPPVRTAPQLTAGTSDDNEIFEYFRSFLLSYRDELPIEFVDVSERYMVKVIDNNGRPIPNASVALLEEENVIQKRLTYSDGVAYLFPKAFPEIYLPGEQNNYITVIGTYGNQSIQRQILRGEGRGTCLQFHTPQMVPNPLPLDIMFIMDTTGSMADEVQSLKDTLAGIHFQITQSPLNIKVRFGMVIYRDRGDEYVTRTIPLTYDVGYFQNKLEEVAADAGGDTPEDVNTAIKEAMEHTDWNRDGLRIAFLIGDAPAHMDYRQSYTYVNGMKSASVQGIKIFTVGCSGLNRTGEYMFRQIAQFTQGKYIFLTYGETTESHKDTRSKVSHATGDQFKVTTLDQAILEAISQELSCLINVDLREIPQIQFISRRESTSSSVDDERTMGRVQVLTGQLVSQIKRQKLEKDTWMVLSLAAKNEDLVSYGEYVAKLIEDQLVREHGYKVAEREKIALAIKEKEFQMCDEIEKDVLKDMKLKGASLIVTGQVFPVGKNIVAVVRVIDVGTGLVKAMARVRI